MTDRHRNQQASDGSSLSRAACLYYLYRPLGADIVKILKRKTSPDFRWEPVHTKKSS